RHTRSKRDWSSDVCSSDLDVALIRGRATDGRVRFEGVRGTSGARAATGLLQIAVASGGTANSRIRRNAIGRARGTRTGAGLRNVTVPRGRSAHRARIARWVGASGRADRAVALVGRAYVPVVR